MSNYQIFYAIALLVCVGGWIGVFYYMLVPPKGYKGLYQKDVRGKSKLSKTTGHGALPTRLLPPQENPNDQTN